MPRFIVSWVVALTVSFSASASPAPSLELLLTESTQRTSRVSDSSVTTITLKNSELTVHEHFARDNPMRDPPPDRDLHRTLDADELGKVRALLGESHLMKQGNVDAGKPRGGCSGVEYHLELRADIDGKRSRRDIRGPISECRKAFPPFLHSQARAGSRYLVNGLKALADPPP